MNGDVIPPDWSDFLTADWSDFWTEGELTCREFPDRLTVRPQRTKFFERWALLSARAKADRIASVLLVEEDAAVKKETENPSRRSEKKRRHLRNRSAPSGVDDPKSEQNPVGTLESVGTIGSPHDVVVEEGSGSAHATPESTVGGQTSCIVCFTGEKTHIGVPCGHQCLCDSCASRSKRCPYCMVDVGMWMRARLV